MKKYDEFIKGLQREIEVPDKVWEKFHDTLSALPDTPCAVKKQVSHWVTAAASIAAVLALGTGFCYANPAEAERIAAKIPIIGRLFEQVEKDVTFSGDYSGKSQNLTEKGEQQEVVNVAEDSGTKITASEIYCDGYSIFLTAKIEFADGKLTNSPSYSDATEGGKTYEAVYTSGSWNIKEETDSATLANNNFEGKIIDDNTFIGMVKIDIGEIERKNGVLELQLTQLGYDDVTMADRQDITASHKVDGQWKMSIPFDIDTGGAGEISVNKKTESGYGISKLFVSPYQVIVYADVPYTTVAEEGLSREAFDQMWEDKTRGKEESVEPPYTYEEYLEEKHYVYHEVTVFDQEGRALRPTGSHDIKSIFAVKNLDISKLHVFVSNNEASSFTLWNAQSMEEARENSIFEVEVDIK